MNKTCLCILTDKLSIQLIRKIQIISQQLQDDIDLWMILDCPDHIKCQTLGYVNIFRPDRKKMKSLKLISGDKFDFRKNCERLFISFYMDYPDYDYYWFMENDVEFFGNWNRFIHTYAGNTDDVILQDNVNYYRGHQDNGFYELFDDFEGKGKHSIEGAFPGCIQEMNIDGYTARDYPYKYIYQIYRLSNRFIQKYIQLIQNGLLKGHFEWAFTAVILRYGFSYSFMRHCMYTFFSKYNILEFGKTLINKDLTDCFIHHKKTVY